MSVGSLLKMTDTGFDIAAGLEAGRTAEQEGKLRADIDIRNAEAVRESAVEQAKITKEGERRLLAAQKSQAAAGGIKVNVGSPLVVAAETRAAIAKDIGFSLKKARIQEASLRASGAIERIDAKAARKESKIRMVSEIAYGSIAFMGSMKNAGKTKTTQGFITTSKIRLPGDFRAETGQSMQGFGQSFLSSGSGFGG